VERNLHDISEEQRKLIKLIFKTRPNGEDRHHMVSSRFLGLSGGILLKNARIFIVFESTGIKDNLVVPTCLNCHNFGNIARVCRIDQRCGHCGETGHKKRLSKQEQRENMRPLQNKNKKCEAKNQQECAQYKLQMQREIEKYDYGSCTTRQRTIRARKKKINPPADKKRVTKD